MLLDLFDDPDTSRASVIARMGTADSMARITGSGSRAMVRMNIERHWVSVDEIDQHGFSALYQAASHNHLAVVSYLLARGASVDLGGCDATFNSPFARATERGFWSIAQLLLDAGADINYNGEATPLHLAAQMDNALALQWLLERGADPTLKGHEFEYEGRTPLQMCCTHSECRVLLRAAIVQWRHKHATVLWYVSLVGCWWFE